MSHDTADRAQVEAIAAQIGSTLMPDNKVWTNRFTVTSTSSSGSVYTVAQRRTDGTWGCDCWGWRRHRHCKHLTDVLRRLAAVAASVEFNADVLAMLRSARTAYLDLSEPAPVAAHRQGPAPALDMDAAALTVGHVTKQGRQLDL